MKKDNMSIKARLDKIAKEEQTIEKIGKFLKTKRGYKFVSMLHRMPLKDLCELNNAQFMRIYSSDTKNMNIIKASIRKFNIHFEDPPKIEPIKPQKVKCQIYLKRDQRKEIEARNKPKKFGFAALMHAYEEHKMQKFVKKHPAPTERELAEDLFPDEIRNAYSNMIDTARYKIRQNLVSAYCKLSIIGRYEIANGKWIEKPITMIKDIDGGGHHINAIPEEHKLIRKAQEIANNAYKEDNSLVCIIIKGHYRQGRLLIPKI